MQELVWSSRWVRLAGNIRIVKSWSLVAAVCFGAALGLSFLPQPIAALGLVGNLLLLAFHLALLPVIANLAAASWVRASGYVWVVLDNVIVVMSMNGVPDEITIPMRLGVHVAAATYLVGASIVNPLFLTRFVGTLAGVWLGGYALAAPFVSEAAYYPAGALLLLWCLLIAFTTRTSLLATPAQSAMA